MATADVHGKRNDREPALARVAGAPHFIAGSTWLSDELRLRRFFHALHEVLDLRYMLAETPA